MLLNEFLDQLDNAAKDEDLKSNIDFGEYDVFAYRHPRYLSDLKKSIVKFRRNFVKSFCAPDPDPLVQQILAGNDLGRLLLHLVFRQVNKQIGYAEHRILRVFAHVNGRNRPVLFGHHAVQRQRQRHPLVMLDAAVVMSI